MILQNGRRWFWDYDPRGGTATMRIFSSAVCVVESSMAFLHFITLTEESPSHKPSDGVKIGAVAAISPKIRPIFAFPLLQSLSRWCAAHISGHPLSAAFRPRRKNPPIPSACRSPALVLSAACAPCARVGRFSQIRRGLCGRPFSVRNLTGRIRILPLCPADGVVTTGRPRSPEIARGRLRSHVEPIGACMALFHLSAEGEPDRFLRTPGMMEADRERSPVMVTRPLPRASSAGSCDRAARRKRSSRNPRKRKER